mmetsp:Transcript_14870/g.22991  ORF Transcript_14870/g.22991 Transcript_14870/m.22991 type:complete len:858 (-) Transcript_14870:120-2693(-)|eukprot:CAMPEP_0201741122 /NCGR_PEP_ID=MMETSP0593-20130828/46649_1 /ASSEMBLY_ACC=CAM_ASM_000672 /TAXON_ID=267983 /ORGANISM="Skeletonema japonicum, Strain CCMP2506" /LENGTH=857 /DNA_ID=CAMNT_0048235449 /DNA_START=2751 /DNA_END=5324 /DNA_ORIENTATION=+
MAPTLTLIEDKDVSAKVATGRALQMSNANRGIRVYDNTTLPREQQTEHDNVVSPSPKNLQASGEEQRFVIGTARDGTISAQARQAAAAPEFTQRPQEVVNNSPYPSYVDVLVREQDEQAAMQAKFYEQMQMTLMAQAQMAKEQHAARAESRAQMKAFMEHADQKAQKTLSEVEKMKEELKTREEESRKREEELIELNRKRDDELKELTREREEELKDFRRKVEETVVKIQAAADEEREITFKAIKKEHKKAVRREKFKEEKKAGKPKKALSYYNIHVKEEGLRLKASGSKEDVFQVASLSWKELDDEEILERYGSVHKLDKERYDREMKEWEKKCEVPVDQRKLAAKPTSLENDATADPRESIVDNPNASHLTPEESVPTAGAAAGPDASDEVSLSSYEQQRLSRIARNNERSECLGLQSPILSNATSKKGREKRRKNSRARNQEHMWRLGLEEGFLSRFGDVALANSSVCGNRNTQDHAADLAGDINAEGSKKEGSVLDTVHPELPSQPPPEEPVAIAVAENRSQVVDNVFFAGATKAEEESTQVPDFIAPNGTDTALNEVAATPPMMTVVIHRRQDAHGATVALAEERTGDSSRATAPLEAAPFLGVVRNSVEEPAHDEEARAASPPDINTNHHRDSAEDPVGAAAPCLLQKSTASLPNKAQELPSATSRRRRGRKRKNHSPYWYKNAPVYELEDYSDGTPLPAGYVWVEYDSGVAVRVEEIALAKKLPARNSSRRLKHDLFTTKDTSCQAEGSSVQPTSSPETINVNCSRGSNDVSEVPFPEGYKFYHNVPGGDYHRGYRCVAEVKDVIGDDDGDFMSPCSMRHCYYYNLDDGSVRGKGKPYVKTIAKKNVYKN